MGKIKRIIFWAGVKDQDLVVLILSILLLFLAYILELGINNIHKYYLMCQYHEFVKTFSLKKKKEKIKETLNKRQI